MLNARILAKRMIRLVCTERLWFLLKVVCGRNRKKLIFAVNVSYT